MRDINKRPSRRSLIRKMGGLSAGAMVGLAGCTRSENSGGGSGGSNSPSGGSGNNNGNSPNSGGGTANSKGNGGSGSNAIKIGLPATMSGPYASLGEFNVEGFRLKAKQINNNGGINGRKIELIVEDNELSGEQAVQNVRKLVNQDNVDLIMGVPSSGVAVAVAPVAKELGVPFISTVNGTGRLTGDLCNRFVFRVNNNAVQGARSMTRYLMEDRNFETLAFVGSDYAWPQSVLEYVRAELKTLDYKPNNVLQHTAFTPLDTQDYSSYISDMANSGAEAGMCLFSGTPAVRFLSQARNFGLMDQMHLSGTTLAQVDHIRPLGEDMQGISSVARWTYVLDTPGNNQWVRNYIKQHGRAPQNFTASAWQGLTAVQKVIQEAGTVNTDPFINTFEGFSWKDPFEGEFTMRACDHQAKNPEYMVEIVGPDEYSGPYQGQIKSTVYPKIVKTYKPETVMRTCKESRQAGCSL